MAKSWGFRLEELCSEDSGRVGRKCANLGEMLRIGLNVPPGFALSTEAYLDFMELSGAREEIAKILQRASGQSPDFSQAEELSLTLRQIIARKEMPAEMARLVQEHYREQCRKCGSEGLAVSVRSAGPKSRPGQYETYLNVAGAEQVLDNIKKVWASTFNARSLAFRRQKGLPLESDPIGVAVIKMVPARSAGVAFTADPNTGDAALITIEANWGLGESVVGGNVSPDIYVVNKANLEIKDKILGSKSRYISAAGSGVIEKETPAEKRAAYALSEDEIKKIARAAQKLEEHFGAPQDVEWAIDEAGGLFLLQSRNEVIAQKKTPVDQIVDLMLSRFSAGGDS